MAERIGRGSRIASENYQNWVQLYEQMQYLSEVKFERYLTSSGAVGFPTLSVFSDASDEASGACAYVRWKLNSVAFASELQLESQELHH